MSPTDTWQYLDSSKRVQGPFRASAMLAWHSMFADEGFHDGLQVAVRCIRVHVVYTWTAEMACNVISLMAVAFMSRHDGVDIRSGDDDKLPFLNAWKA